MNDQPASEMARLTLEFEDIDDFDMLCDAARIAGRSPEQFVLEEVLYLAGMIAATGGTQSVRLARHHRERNAEFFAAFRKGAMQDTAIADWARSQSRLRHPTLAETIAWAEELHAEQYDASGAPYVGHLQRSSAHLLRCFPDAGPAERHAVWLHDSMKDQGVTEDDLRMRGYGPEVIRIVKGVTRNQASGSYQDWIEAMAAAAHWGTIRVKVADLLDNSDPDRLRALPVDKAEFLSERYGLALQTLESII
jgi:uncharacterized protein (DUF1778 family)